MAETNLKMWKGFDNLKIQFIAGKLNSEELIEKMIEISNLEFFL